MTRRIMPPVIRKIARWRNASTNRLLFSAAVLIGALSGLTRLAGIGKELIVASFFGTSDVLDAFLIAYVVPSFVINIVAGSFGAALMPIYIQTRELDGEEASHQFYNAILTWSILLLGGITVLILLFAPLYLPLLGSGFSPEQVKLSATLLYILSPLIVFSGIASVWAALLNAEHAFALPAIIPILTPVVVSIFMITAGRELGIFALAAGTLLGQILETVFLAVSIRGRVKIRLSLPRFEGRLKQAMGQYIPMAAGALLMGSTQIVDQAFAASLPAGSVSALSYGNRLISLPLTLVATALGTAVLPFFSRMVARQDWSGLRSVFRKYLFLIFTFTVPATFVLIWFSEPLVRLILLRGAFTEQDAALVARIQALAALQIPFYLGGILVVRTISSLQANHIIMWGTIITVLVNIIADLIFIRIWGLAGIALSTSLVYFVSFSFLCINLLLLLRKKS